MEYQAGDTLRPDGLAQFSRDTGLVRQYFQTKHQLNGAVPFVQPTLDIDFLSGSRSERRAALNVNNNSCLGASTAFVEDLTVPVGQTWVIDTVWAAVSVTASTGACNFSVGAQRFTGGPVLSYEGIINSPGLLAVSSGIEYNAFRQFEKPLVLFAGERIRFRGVTGPTTGVASGLALTSNQGGVFYRLIDQTV